MNEQPAGSLAECAMQMRESFLQPVLILVSIQLGLNSIPHEYFGSIQALFKMRNCVGAVGGKPSFAHYFVGLQTQELTGE